MITPGAPDRSEPTRFPIPSARITLAGLGLGLVAGVAAHAWPAPAWRTAAGILDPLGTLWLSALRMLVLPLLVSILLVAIGRGGSGLVGRLGARTLGWFLGFLAVAAVLAVLFGRLVLEAIPVPDAARVAFQAGGTEAGPPAAQPTVRDWIVSLMPSNLFAAAAREDLLALIVATVLFGLALRSVSLPGRTLLLDLAGAVSEWCLALAGLLLRVLPAAVFVLTFVSTARTGVSLASGLVYYIALLCVGLSLGILLLYPITAWLARMSVTRFAAGAWPVQVMAFSTRSSVACLPAMLDAARSRLRLPDAVSSFTLPLAVASFKMNVAISANLQLLFLLHVYGLSPNLLEVGLAVVALTVQSFITPGLPSGAIWTTTPVYLSLGIPLPGIVLANVVDTIPDLFKTTINVTADLSITSIVAHQTGPVPATE